MEYSDIKKIIEDMGNSNLDNLEIEFPDGLKIKMEKDSQDKMIKNTNDQELKKVMIDEVSENETLKLESKADENYKIVKSPMVGTFYASSAPDKEPFVKVGDKIKKGQVVCIVEAMKLMNEIESEFDGEVVEICVNNEDMVEYGAPLFKLK